EKAIKTQSLNTTCHFQTTSILESAHQMWNQIFVLDSAIISPNIGQLDPDIDVMYVDHHRLAYILVLPIIPRCLPTERGLGGKVSHS
uniref:hypothetical protein n=1 Tax=Salmonella sp. s51933 TaxID=3160127 RepID=UPI003754A78A